MDRSTCDTAWGHRFAPGMMEVCIVHSWMSAQVRSSNLNKGLFDPNNKVANGCMFIRMNAAPKTTELKGNGEFSIRNELF